MASARTDPVPKETVNATKDTSSSSPDECEFLIAADLTLYGNPLRCLQKKSKASSNTKTDEKKEEGKDNANKGDHHEEREVIAADLTKYGSPLDG